MEIAKQFGIQPVLLLAQIVNFLIILFVLKKFFYKPIVKMLEDRKAKIAESLENAEIIEEKLAKTEERTAKILDDARTQAQVIITDTKSEAERIYEQATVDARKAGEELLVRAKDQIEKEKQDMKNEIEQETMVLVTGVVQKVLSRNLTAKEKNQMTAKSLAEITTKIQ